MRELDDIVSLLSRFDGITRKFVLPEIIHRLRHDSYNGDSPHSLGEDSAAIGTDSDDFVLLTTDAILQELCLEHPRAAGFNVVLANVMDIYAAGGIPTSFAVALSYSDPMVGDQILQGLIDASHIFRVPIVRGHTNPTASSTYVVGSATGTVRKCDLLTAGGANLDDILVLIFDKQGKKGAHYRLGWDSVSGRSSDEVMQRLSVMNDLAKSHLVHASKDVSVAGLVGTAGMMLEYSGLGGVVDLRAVESSSPPSVSLRDWLRMYISLGFLVSVPSSSLDTIQGIASSRLMVAIPIGRVEDSKTLDLSLDGVTRMMFDFAHGPVLTPTSGHVRPSSPT